MGLNYINSNVSSENTKRCRRCSQRKSRDKLVMNVHTCINYSLKLIKFKGVKRKYKKDVGDVADVAGVAKGQGVLNLL